MHARIVLLGLVLVAGLGGAAGAAPVASGPIASAPVASAVKPLAWTLVGNVRDYMCPDSLATPLVGQSPDV